MREPLLGVAIGRKGVGKSYTTNKLIEEYVTGNLASGILPRKALILDVNDEYEHIKGIAVKDLIRFSVHPHVEARRIRPFHPDGKKMRLDEKLRTVDLLAPQMRLDLGSIAKGYACDQAARVLKGKGFPISLVAAGGDTVAGDAPPGRKGWRVEVGSLDVEGETSKPMPPVVEIANAAISTSGDRFQRLEIGGKRYSHILDPRTGQPLTDHNLVTVIAHDGLTAGISTACSVIGPEQGLKLVAEWKAAARFQRQPAKKVEVTESPGWSDWLMK